MLATSRRLLLALVALAASTPVFAEIVCNPNPDGSWTCSGYGGGGSYPPGTVVTNVVGVCTNCVAMSPSACEDLKSGIISSVESAESNAQSVLQNISDTLQYGLEPLKAEGDSFYPSQSYHGLSLSDVSSFSQSQYARSSTGSTSITTVGNYSIGNNSIVNYYQQAVKPVLESSITALNTSKSEVSSVLDSLSGIEVLVDSVDCSSCSASFGGPSTTTNSPPSSGSCPCNEQMEAIKSLLQNDFLPRIKKIDTNVAQLTNLITITREQLRVTKEGFHNVTNLFNRLDDYVLDDFSNRVYQIRYDVNFIASNLAQKVRNIFIDQSYSNAQFYVRQDSDTPITMKTLDETLIPEGDVTKFDWGEFENLPWFTRVEYLLLKLNGVYVTTNNNANAGVSKAEENQKAIEDGFSDFKSSVNGDIKTGFTRVGTSITSFFTSFNSAVSTQGDKVVEIHLMSNFIGNEPLMLNIDPDVADACRTISSLLWTVLFGFLLYKIMIYFWVVFVDTINWWVNQTQGFVK